MKILLSILIASSLSAISLQAQVANPKQPQQLTFAWPNGAEAEITYSVEGWRRNGGTTTTVRRNMKYRMQVRNTGTPGESEFEIERIWPDLPKKPKQPKESLFGGSPFQSNSAVQTLIDDLPELVPLLQVSADGRLLSIGGMDNIEARRDRALEESKANLGMRRQVNALLSEDSVYLMSHQAWAALVTIWNGRHLEEDFPFDDRSDADVPSEPLRVEVPGSGRFDGWVACNADDTAQRCVQLHWSATPQGEDAEEALEALENRPLDDLDLTREITVVVDPATLLPYSTVDHLKAKRSLQRGSETLESSEEMTRKRHFSWTLPQ